MKAGSQHPHNYAWQAVKHALFLIAFMQVFPALEKSIRHAVKVNPRVFNAPKLFQYSNNDSVAGKEATTALAEAQCDMTASSNNKHTAETRRRVGG